MEKELYYKLESNDGKGYIIVDSMNTVCNLIDTDISDINPTEREQAVYTIAPVYMTEDEYAALNENEDW